MRNFYFQFILAILFFSACSENKPDSKKDSVSVPAVSVDSPQKITVNKIEPRKISENTLACFYVLNDKNAHSPDSATIAQWLYPFLDSLNENIVSSNENLFNKDAGPMGARLNPMADIVASAIFTGEIDTNSVAFKLNDFDILKSAVHFRNNPAKGLTICWVIIPRNRYSAMLHLPSEKEKQEICTRKNMNEKNWAKNSCTILKLSVSTKENGREINLSDYFLATYVQ